MKSVLCFLSIIMFFSPHPAIGHVFATTTTDSSIEKENFENKTTLAAEAIETSPSFDEENGFDNEKIASFDDDLPGPWENDSRLQIILDSGNNAYVTHDKARVEFRCNGIGGYETHIEYRKLLSLDAWQNVDSITVGGGATSSSLYARWLTNLEPGTIYQVRWYYYHINPILRRIGAMSTFTTASRPVLDTPVVSNTTINSATFNQSVSINANDSKYLPTKMDMYLTNTTTGVIQILSYSMDQISLGYSNQNEINSLQFTIGSLAENTEYTLQTVLWTGTGREVGVGEVTSPQVIDSSRSPTITFRTKLDELQVTTQSVTLPLGSSLVGIEAKSMIKEIKLKGSTIDKNQYSAEIINSIETNAPGSRTAEIKIDYGLYSSIVTVPVSIVWGSSIRVFGSWTGSSDSRTISAYTWHPGKGITFVPGQIASSLTTNALAQAGPNSVSKLSVLSGDEDIMIGTSAKIFDFEIKGNETPNTASENFINKTNQEGIFAASVGDVVESWHIYKNNESIENSILNNRQWNVLMANETIIDRAGNRNSVFYEITTNGFQPLVVNQTIGKKGTISRYMTNSELDQAITEYLDLPVGVSSVGFDQYPDRSTIGETQAKIRVEEQLSTGKKIQYSVPVEFEVVVSEDDWIEVTLPIEMMFYGTTFESGIQTIQSPEYNFTNRSTVPITLSIDSIENETTINRLLLLHIHGEPYAYDVDIIVGGRVLNNVAINDFLNLGTGETERIGFTGDAFFFTEESNPYFEMVFKVSI